MRNMPLQINGIQNYAMYRNFAMIVLVLSYVCCYFVA